MSDFSDPSDFASVREKEIRDDALEKNARILAEQAMREPAEFCRICEEEIPQERRERVAGVQLCFDCQTETEEALKRMGL